MEEVEIVERRLRQYLWNRWNRESQKYSKGKQTCEQREEGIQQMEENKEG